MDGSQQGRGEGDTFYEVLLIGNVTFKQSLASKHLSEKGSNRRKKEGKLRLRLNIGFLDNQNFKKVVLTPPPSGKSHIQPPASLMVQPSQADMPVIVKLQS